MRARATIKSRCAIAVVVTVLPMAGCSGGGSAQPADGAPSTPAATQPSTQPSTGASDSDAVSTLTPLPDATVPPGPPITFETVPETGIPGLDSTDAFCAAWSRFGGSWQVMLAAAYFGDDRADAYRLEVLASPVVADAYDDLFAAWPVELDGERDIVADAYFGAFRRRSADALDSLRDVGATPGDEAALSAAWLAALAARDPEQPVLAVDVPADLEALVEQAAADLATRRVAFPTDPSMTITADTPATDQFLAVSCPDQGLLAGQDVIDGD